MRAATLLCCACLICLGPAVPAPAQTPVDPALLGAPGDGGLRRWQVMSDHAQGFARPDASSAKRQAFTAGDILANRGCRTAGGQTWCEVRPLAGGPRQFLRASDMAPAAGPDGQVPVGPDDSAQRLRRGKPDATATIQCAQERGQTLGTCAAAVARSPGGDATVEVTFPNSFKRRLSFAHGQFIRASATMSGVGTDMDWRMGDGVFYIRVDDQRFEIPANFVLGTLP